MKEIKIKLPRKRYLPGEVVQGKVVLKSDLNFTCIKASLNIVGHMIHTYVETKSKGKRGASSEVKERIWNLYEAKSEFAENMDLRIGISEFPFQFQLPDDLKPSYRTSTLQIVYHVYAIMGVSEKEVYNGVSEFDILHSIVEVPDESIEESGPQGFKDKSLIVRMDSHRHCIGDNITFSYFVDTDMKFNTLRAEIEHTEKIGKKATRILMKREIPSEEITRHEWKKLSLFSETRIPPSLSIKKFQSSLALKVSLVRKFSSDQTVRIPLIAGHCLKPGWDEVQEQEPESIRHPFADRRPPSTPKPAQEVTVSDKERVAQNWYNKAVTFRDRGEIEQALQSIETALKWHPDSAEALALRDELKKHEE